uniref:Aminoglycoside N(3)-acetyltransferase n=1 Tax=Pseudomonas aeruginosa TaxID=287 RepID=A0A1J0AL01_PSEAI|nr:AAC(3)-like protein [Pseudomonas aeruginosa]
MSERRWKRQQMESQLVQLGVREGDLLMVHASLRSLGSVIGGANSVMQALLGALGPTGTLCAYVDFEPFFEENDDPASIPVFDKQTASAARDHGVLHETLRKWPGALRSDHPDAGVAAIGPKAAWLIENHPLQYGYGPGSPFDRFVQATGRVLHLGSPLDTTTLIHYAEHLAPIPGKRLVRYRRLLPTEQGASWVEIEEFDTSDPVADYLPVNCFELIVADYLKAGMGSRGPIGDAECHLLEAQELTAFAVDWLQRYAALHAK